ncbi:MAG: DinB family protein [Armatimonadota bacterium]|nr:DinB family protein [Armatimonadota bacterium]MDW8155665.1 DinB family protein [Armatimonadota bacterium]
MGETARLAKHLDDLRRAVVEVVQAMDDAQLNTRPTGLANSPGILLRHLLGSERYWVHQVVGGEDVRRDREAEFDPSVPVRKEELLRSVEEVARRTHEILDGLEDERLQDAAEARVGGRTLQLQKGDAILRAVEHWAYHSGQLRLMRRLLGVG